MVSETMNFILLKIKAMQTKINILNYIAVTWVPMSATGSVRSPYLFRIRKPDSVYNMSPIEDFTGQARTVNFRQVEGRGLDHICYFDYLQLLELVQLL